MTREEAKDVFLNRGFIEAENCRERIFRGDKWREACMIISEWLKEEQKWIPVSERLPEEGVDVLACFYTGEKNYKIMVSRRSDCNYWNGVGRTSDMVAWMPLPKPYKAESEE